jgi:hypothetical protein
VKKNLFKIDLDKSSDVYGSQSLKACDPCAAECEKINRKINNFLFNDCAHSYTKGIYPT